MRGHTQTHIHTSLRKANLGSVRQVVPGLASEQDDCCDLPALALVYLVSYTWGRGGLVSLI